MTTNLKGRYFISYRRSPARKTGTQEAELVRNALRDRGAPTWRDLDDLAAEPTEDELVATLNDPNTAGAVLLVSPEVAQSDIIRKVEAYRIFQRHAASDGFIVKPVLLGLGYGDANQALDSPAGFQSLGNWNLYKLANDELTPSDARTIARKTLKTRLELIAGREPKAPIELGLYSRRGGGPGPFALRHDFSNYFEGRTALPGTFDKIESALLDTAGAVLSSYNEPSILAEGNASLPLGVLFGAVFSPLAGFKVSWKQGMSGHPIQQWSFAVDKSDFKINTRRVMSSPASEDIVLALGVSANLETAVTEYLNQQGVEHRAAIHISIPGGSVEQGLALTPEDGANVVLQAIQAVRQIKDDLGLRRVRLHLFLACPLAMAVLLGQKLNTLSECILYEHDPNEIPSYTRIHNFHPSGFSYSS